MDSTQVPGNVAPLVDPLENTKAIKGRLDHDASTYDYVVSELTKNIRTLIERERSEGRDPIPWLQMLYSHYSTRFLSDNGRIWTTGSILIPVSLAGFAALVALDDPSWPHVVILMYGSVSLMFVWVMIAQAHRAFQRKSQAWLLAIERAIGLVEVGKPKLAEGRRSISTLIRVQTWRWILLCMVIVGWLGALALTLLGWL